MSNNTTPEELTKLALFLGRIPETHIKSLEAFPFIYFNGVTEVKLDYSVETSNKAAPTLFSYSLLFSDDASNNHMHKRYKALEQAVRDLFWKEALIEIKISDVGVYKSE